MGLFQKIIGRSSHRHISSSLLGTSFLSLHKRAGIELAGAFVFAGAVGAFALATRPTDTHTVIPKTSTFTLSPVPASPPPTPAAAPLNAFIDSDTSSINNNSSYSSESGNESNGSVSTQVSVNGQPIDVPENGSVHKTVSTPAGQTSVDVSSSSSTTGDSSNTTTTTNTVQVFSGSTGTSNTSIDINSSNASP